MTKQAEIKGAAGSPEGLPPPTTEPTAPSGEAPAQAAGSASLPDSAKGQTGLPALHTPSPAPPVTKARGKGWLLAGVAVALIAVGLYFAARPWLTRPPAVAVELVAPGPVTRVLAVNGHVAALHSVAVRAAVSGTLTGPLADAGDRVTAGDIVAHIDPALQEAVLQQAEQALAAGEVARQQAAATFSRTEAMQANVPRMTLEDAARSLASAGNDVRRLSALVDQARIQLGKFTVTAPITGTILARKVDPGQLVDTAMPLFTLADLSHLVVEADVDETYAAQIAVDQPALMQLVGETQTRPGHVSFVAPEVTAETGGVLVKLAFDAAPAMPVGLTVTANITVETQAAALTLPRSALIAGGISPAVFLLKDGEATRTPVTVVDWPAARLIATSGLAAGDSLIVAATGLSDGQAVRAAGP